MNGFKLDPIFFFQGDELERAAQSLTKYQNSYTGRCFDRLAQQSDPNKITTEDIVAVTMLSVPVPAEAAIWMLYEGADEITECLERIPRDQTIWDDAADVGPNGPAWRLWDILREQHGLGPVTTSKLLAAKRPDLIPVYDDYVANALYKTKTVEGTWDLWRARLRPPSGDELRLVAAIANGRTDPHLSLLRAIDIVVWMRVHGDETLGGLPGPGNRPAS